MFFCEYCEISKNTLFTEHLWATAWRQLYRTPLDDFWASGYVLPTRSNTALSQEKPFQRLNKPYRVLSKDALTNNHTRCVSSNQLIHQLNKII